MIDLSQETEALARRLADVRRVTVDAAVRQALEASAHPVGVRPEPSRRRDLSSEAIAVRRQRVAWLVGEIAAMPILDKRTLRKVVDDLNAP